jgi:hypothetical protein
MYDSSGRGIGPSQRTLLDKHNIHNRETHTLQAGFETAIQEKERPQNYALDIAATGLGWKWKLRRKNICIANSYEYIKQVTR